MRKSPKAQRTSAPPIETPEAMRARIRELERENAELRRSHEILAVASSFFGRVGAKRRPKT